MTAGGNIEFHRLYFRCDGCKANEFPCDRRLGVDGSLTKRGRKLVCLFGSHMAGEAAVKHLKEACGLRISDNGVRRTCYEQGTAIAKWRAKAEGAEQFEQACGEVEFQVDGTTVNTVDEGWKEVKVAAFLKREPGEPAAAHEWDQRRLPKPSAVSVRISMESAEEFAGTWRTWAATLGIVAFTAITVLGDGAKWIWNQTRIQFPKASGVLDIFHLLEHVTDAVRQVHGDATGATNAWRDSARRALLRHGWSGICGWVGRWRECHPEKAVAPSEELLGYLANHTHHLDYPTRLANGRSIGSGQIEGSCKYVIGRRLKHIGGRWRISNVSKMATLCSTHYAHDWDAYWQACLSPKT